MSATGEQEKKVPIDKLVKVYVKIRDAREELSRKFEESDGELKDQQDIIKQQILDTCKELNIDSLKTGAGTVTRSVKTRYWSSDWGAMREFIEDRGLFDLMEKRLHQTNMKAFLQENPGERVPGLNSDSYYDITVRRSK
jgi:hypothetical protein